MSSFFARFCFSPLWSPYKSIATRMLRASLPPPGGNPPPPWYGDSHLPPGDNHPPPREIRRWIIGLIGALVISSLWWYPIVSRIISTQNLTAPIGKRLLVRMSDGSTFVLKPDSTIALWHDRQQLRLELRKGDVLCDLTRNPFRQFELFVNDVRIVDTGTVFSVSKTGSGFKVLVQEGSVRLSGPHLEQTSLTHNERASIDSRAQHSAVDDISPEEVARELSWRDGYLVFQGEKLSAVVHEINRYDAHGRIEVTDPAIADLPISITVNDPTDIDNFARRLANVDPIRLIIHHAPDGTIYALHKAH
jgi:ferric-dicitrate binding protein FerR (iron transport regulator)